MPLHLLGKKSWNVYNAANIARVKADEAAAAAREAAEDEKRQEIDAARRAAILRGQTPPPLPEEEEDTSKDERRSKREGHERKRRKLAGEDDTDMDIRLAASVTAPKEGDIKHARTLMLRKPDSEAPLTDHAGNINLFPIDAKEVRKREKNEEAQKEKKKKEQALEDQYTMRFSNAAGRGGIEKPWYTSGTRKAIKKGNDTDDKSLDYADFRNKDVWGNEDPRRKEREQARIISNDPFAFMQKAQVQLKRSKEDKKKWADERERELRELRDTQDKDARRRRHAKRKDGVEDDEQLSRHREYYSGDRTSKPRHRSRSRSRSRSPRSARRQRHGSRRSRSQSQERANDAYIRKPLRRHEQSSKSNNPAKDIH